MKSARGLGTPFLLPQQKDMCWAAELLNKNWSAQATGWMTQRAPKASATLV